MKVNNWLSLLTIGQRESSQPITLLPPLLLHFDKRLQDVRLRLQLVLLSGSTYHGIMVGQGSFTRMLHALRLVTLQSLRPDRPMND